MTEATSVVVAQSQVSEASLAQQHKNITSSAARIDEIKLETVRQPVVDIVKIGNGEDLVFTAEVYVKPEVELGKYKGIEVVKKVHNVDLPSTSFQCLPSAAFFNFSIVSA